MGVCVYAVLCSHNDLYLLERVGFRVFYVHFMESARTSDQSERIESKRSNVQQAAVAQLICVTRIF